MRVYLVQHGEAVPAAENPERPLTDKGRRDVERLAAFLARAGVRVQRVIHSGRRRALETALLLAEAVGRGGAVEEAESGLAPDDSTDAFAHLFAGADADLMIVGHQPFMGRLASRLVAGAEDRAAVAFVPGTVACVERTAAGGWGLAWLVRPELLGR